MVPAASSDLQSVYYMLLPFDLIKVFRLLVGFNKKRTEIKLGRDVGNLFIEKIYPLSKVSNPSVSIPCTTAASTALSTGGKKPFYILAFSIELHRKTFPAWFYPPV
jgi:hypothetical protein